MKQIVMFRKKHLTINTSKANKAEHFLK